jgi:Protein of unknown function (DUF2804)
MSTKPLPEITAPVDLCLPTGRLNPAAVGWSRTPLHRTNLPRGVGRAGAWGRNKRWEYWGIITPTHIIGMTVSSLDYAGVHQLWVLERASGTVIDAGVTVPFAAGTVLPATLGDGPTFARRRGFALEVSAPVAQTVRLRAKTDRVRFDLTVEVPDGHEVMAVVVPWNERRFQYTVKDVALRVGGRLRVDGVDVDAPSDASWAVLDHGRGRWPYSMVWNWGAGSGVVDGRVVGLTIGGKWTEGTASTENALVVDGRVHMLLSELDWQYDRDDWMAPWRVTGPRVDLAFTPFHERVAVTSLLVLSGETHQCFGHWSGTVVDDDGLAVSVDGLVGWAEEARNRW